MAEVTERLHAVVHGTVQGVNFRRFAHQSALGCGVTGWVRNLPDGTVETVVEGPRSALEGYLRALNTGSPYSTVTRVDANWGAAEGSFSRFSIEYA